LIGDLDNIALMALRKEAQRRYASRKPTLCVRNAALTM
jgi:hypothetical protein